MAQDRYLNKSLDKALKVLDVFDDSCREGLSLTELAQLLETRPGTIYPILHTLECAHYLIRDLHTKRYRLGLKILAKANHLLSSLDIREQAKPILRRLTQTLNTNSYLGVLYKRELLYLDCQEVAVSISTISRPIIGLRDYLHCTALGKVLIAHNSEIAEHLLKDGELPVVTIHTIASPVALRHELDGVAKQGYALDKEESQIGNICVAAPVRDYQSRVIAAISVAITTSRFEHEPLDRLTTAVIEGANEISQNMGHSVPD